MDRGVNIFTVLILHCITLSSAEENLVPVFISEMGSFLQTDQVGIRKEDSAFDCVQRCVETLHCKSINYKRQGNGVKNCYLNRKNRREAGEAAMRTDKSFIHYDLDYHTQRSEEPEFGTADINMPTVPPIVAAKPRACDSNPCKNGGTCVEIRKENRFHCNCTVEFTGDTCEQKKSIGAPASENDYDFELVFRSTNVANFMEYNFIKYVSELTVCAWIFTPGIVAGQQMTVWSIRTPLAAKTLLRTRIDGDGGFNVSWGDQWSRHPDHFPKSPKDGWIHLCVIFEKQGNTPTVEAIVNADYGSKVSTIAITERLQNVKITRLVVGQEQKKDLDNPNFSPEYSFEGRIADMNVWNRGLDKYHIDILYQGTGWQGNAILKWNTLGFPNKRFGEVRFISITSALRRVWRNVTQSELVINKTSNVVVTAYNNPETGELVVNITLNSPNQCSDASSAPVDAVLISVPGNWKRILFEQNFKETQQCYAIFGSVPSWAPSNFPDPGIKEFDPNQDEIWKEEFLGGVDVHQYSGVNTLCGEQHFWAVNNMRQYGAQSKAGISLRRKASAHNTGISTYGKCGKFSFIIKDIRVLEG